MVRSSHTIAGFRTVLDPGLPLDNAPSVTVTLHIMRDRPVTYQPDLVFIALSDPTRRAVLDLLRSGSLPAGEIAQVFPVSRPAISKHLRLLRRAYLVSEVRRSRHRFYSLNPAPLKAVDAWLNQYRVFWEASLTSLRDVVESENAKRTPAGRRKKS
jgi:DNA-binding transcriptional ArsR family regulator